jgi:hypothetical protein
MKEKKVSGVRAKRHGAESKGIGIEAEDRGS